MPRGELRISGTLQAAVIALVVGWMFRDVPADGAAKAWPFVLGGYGVLAATLPWLAGGVGRSELSLRSAAILGVIGALPFALAAWWLTATPYFWLGVAWAVLVALWCALVAVAGVLAIVR